MSWADQIAGTKRTTVRSSSLSPPFSNGQSLATGRLPNQKAQSPKVPGLLHRSEVVLIASRKRTKHCTSLGQHSTCVPGRTRMAFGPLPTSIERREEKQKVINLPRVVYSYPVRSLIIPRQRGEPIRALRFAPTQGQGDMIATTAVRAD